MDCPDYRAELHALLNVIQELRIEGGEPKHGAFRTGLDRARAALAAKLQQPSDEEIAETFARAYVHGVSEAGKPLFVIGARAVLARYGCISP